MDLAALESLQMNLGVVEVDVLYLQKAEDVFSMSRPISDTTFLIFRPISLKFLIVTIACPGAGSVRWAAIWCAYRDRVAGRASSANEKPARYPAGSGRAMFYTVTRC